MVVEGVWLLMVVTSNSYCQAAAVEEAIFTRMQKSEDKMTEPTELVAALSTQ